MSAKIRRHTFTPNAAGWRFLAEEHNRRQFAELRPRDAVVRRDDANFAWGVYMCTQPGRIELDSDHSYFEDALEHVFTCAAPGLLQTVHRVFVVHGGAMWEMRFCRQE